jgi:Membrane domain of glycerophosphoryl diester phosphodiesterase
MQRIDMRPMSLGEVLDRTFTLYRENFMLFVGISALPRLLSLAAGFLILWMQYGLLGGAGAQPNISTRNVGTVIGGSLLIFLITYSVLLIVYVLTQAATVWAVSELYMGRATTVRDSLLSVKPVMGSVLGTMIFSGLITFAAFIALILPGIYFACRLAVAVPACVVEKNSAGASVTRSLELTKGFFWQIFLLLMLVVFLAWSVTAIVEAPTFIFSFRALAARQTVGFGVAAYNVLATFVAQVFVGPVGTIAASLMYFNLRVKKEGFDIQHMLNTLSPAPAAPPTAASLPGAPSL